MSKKNNYLLRSYIRESLILNESLNTSGLKTAAKSLFNFGGSASGPQKWFSDFMSQKLDAAGESLSKYLAKKLTNILPDELQKDTESKYKTDQNNYSDDLAKMVNGWIDNFENKTTKIAGAKKKEIINFAIESYTQELKKNKNSNIALLQVIKNLDAKYNLEKTKSG